MSAPPIDRITEIVRRHLGLLAPDEPIRSDANLRELGLDSMAAVDLLLDVEHEFGVVLPDAMLSEETFRTPESLAAAVGSLLGGGQEDAGARCA